jgi:hypothetical protein
MFNEGVEVLQALTIISAPIAISSPSDYDEFEQDATGEDDDLTTSNSSDADLSSQNVQSASDDFGSEDGSSNADKNAEDDEIHKSVTPPLEATLRRHNNTENGFKDNKGVNDHNSQRLAKSSEQVHTKSVFNDGTHQKICSSNSSYEVFPPEEGTALMTGDCHHRKTTEGDFWRLKKPIPSSVLVEVEDDILDYTDSPNELLRGNGKIDPLHDDTASQLGAQSGNSHHSCRTDVSCRYREGPQKRKQSQASVELGYSNLSAPSGSGDGESCSQVQSPDFSTRDCHNYIVEEYGTHLARALDSFSSSSQVAFSPVRSKSMPLNHRFRNMDQQANGDHIAGNIEISPAFKHTVSLLNRSLSQM